MEVDVSGGGREAGVSEGGGSGSDGRRLTYLVRLERGRIFGRLHLSFKLLRLLLGLKALVRWTGSRAPPT
eukprot:314074-Chlamydomonas_euryale.AAC.3